MRAIPWQAVAGERWRLSAITLGLGGLFIVGLVLRLVWVFYTDTIPLGGDPSWYYGVAVNLTRGFGFVATHNELFEVPGPRQVTAFWPPAYPIVLAGLWKVTGISLTSAKVFNAVAGALTIPFIYGLGRHIFDNRAGLLAAGNLISAITSSICSKAWTVLANGT